MVDAPLYTNLRHALALDTSPFQRTLRPGRDDLVYCGGAISAPWLIAAYTSGCFPWTGEAPIPWYNPDPRLLLLPQRFKASRNLRKLAGQDRYLIRFDTDFQEVMRACAEPRAEGEKTWITPGMIDVYGDLFNKHIAHCVSVYREDSLVGGLYGLNFGRGFFGESMFFREANTSKLALFALSRFLAGHDFDFIDCQQVTPHLISLGGAPLRRTSYMRLLADTLKKQSLHEPWFHHEDTRRHEGRRGKVGGISPYLQAGG